MIDLPSQNQSINIAISPLESDVLPGCAALFLRVFNHPPWNENWQIENVVRRLTDCFNTPGFYGVVAETPQQVVGFCLGCIEQWDTSKHFYLKEMCVATEYQRRGIGSALIDTMEEQLIERRVTQLYLHTARETAAHHFCEKQGYDTSSKMVTMLKRL